MSEVASGGYSKPQRWADALKSAASLLEGVRAVHGKGSIAKCLGEDSLATVRTAVRHGLSTEGIAPRCATQLQRLKKVLESKESDVKAAKSPKSSSGSKQGHAGTSAAKSAKGSKSGTNGTTKRKRSEGSAAAKAA